MDAPSGSEGATVPSHLVCSNPLLFYLLKPAILQRLSRRFPSTASLRILDLGCGNHSVRYVRTQFPGCYYVGVDRSAHTNTEDDFREMNEFHQIDLDAVGLSVIPDRTFDLVILSHVIEHLRNGPSVVTQAVRKLRPGGTIYIAHPHAASVGFPSRRGTLNFRDDPTHITIYPPGAAARLLTTQGCAILTAGRTRSARNLAMMPLRLALGTVMGWPIGPALWDLYGFEEFVIGEAPPEALEVR
jgi:SAM-dependent methyltransferase